MRKFLCFLVVPLFLLLVAGNAAALTISADASGSATIYSTVTYPDTITNGDFTITGNNIATLVGNGIDEYTTWDFDFSSDSNYAAFSTSDPLTSALLTLTLTPMNGLITTDSVRIEGLTNITDTIQSLTVGTTSTIEIELLDYYTSDQILSVFANSPTGIIGMYYQDDAILSYASLDLSNSAPVPEPATIMLLGAGLVGLAGASRRKLRK